MASTKLDAFTHGIAKNLAFYSLVIMNGLSFFGRLFAGFFAQKLGILNLMILATSCCGILILCMIALKNIASLITIAILYGFWSGIYVTLLSPLIAMLTSNLSELGLRIGVSFFVSGVATLIGPPINGALLGKNFRWWRPSLFSGIVALAGSFFLLLTARALARKKKNQTPA
uniref:Major facilitator superfamily (MFS) profile domain-containing protein n=1 Tax=Mycena chlorophos TaxID=658473 RepID=A0ABQ0LKG2_MYCCL|nr:predicted protein [Mycena chlorophos]